jgi:hypothetical protein
MIVACMLYPHIHVVLYWQWLLCMDSPPVSPEGVGRGFSNCISFLLLRWKKSNFQIIRSRSMNELKLNIKKIIIIKYFWFYIQAAIFHSLGSHRRYWCGPRLFAFHSTVPTISFTEWSIHTALLQTKWKMNFVLKWVYRL